MRKLPFFYWVRSKNSGAESSTGFRGICEYSNMIKSADITLDLASKDSFCFIRNRAIMKMNGGVHIALFHILNRLKGGDHLRICNYSRCFVLKNGKY